MQTHTIGSDAKRRAIEQWSADPCGSNTVDADPGTREYFAALVDARREYAPWLDAALEYDACAGLQVLDVVIGRGRRPEG